MIKEKVTKETKSKEKQTNEIIVKDFYADWCSPCKMQEPIIEDLKEKYKTVKFEKIDIDKNKKEAERFKVQAIPTIIITKNGTMVNRLVGVRFKKELEKELDNLLLNNKRNIE